MIWRSVVGKLWLTIIALVTLVLLILTFFMTGQILSTYYEAELNNMNALVREVQDTLQGPEKESQEGYLRSVLKVAELNETYTILLDPDGSVKSLAAPKVPDMPWRDILEQTEIDKVFRGEPVSLRTRVIVGDQGSLFKDEVMLVALPLKKGEKVTGAVVMYRTQGQLSENEIKKVILYSVLIGIFLTTIFAFFLSSRITQPLIQMKRGAERMARGEFSARVPVRSHERDEIGDLAVTFNRMAGQLEESIQALSREKEQLASILRSMADGVITLDAKGHVIMTNPPAERFLSDWRKTKGDSAWPSPLEQFFRQVLEGEKEVFGDIDVHGSSWALVMAPLYASPEEIRGAVAVLRDVTEERRMDKLRKDFVANVSHELRTPLSMLQGYSEALMDDIAASPEDQREITRVIHDESLRMGRLVGELLDLARMEAGYIRLEPSTMDVLAMIRRVHRKFQAISKEEKVALQVDLPDGMDPVQWDEDKVEQVLTNLVDNAIRHTPEGGRVTLRAVPAEKGVQLIVEDTGSGIPQEDLPFIFERFYKADKARTRGQGGTGLGLAIAKHIVEAHAGSVSVKSIEGKGTRFTVQLPMKTPMEKKTS